MWISCFGERVHLSPGLKYTGIEVIQKCLAIRRNADSLSFNAVLEFNLCPSVLLSLALDMYTAAGGP